MSEVHIPPSSAGLLKQSGPWVERVGFGGAASHARADRSRDAVQLGADEPDESPMSIRALVIWSTALRSTGTACPARPDAISCSHAPARVLVAICEGSNGTAEVALADLAFPPDTVPAWIHAAYRTTS